LTRRAPDGAGTRERATMRASRRARGMVATALVASILAFGASVVAGDERVDVGANRATVGYALGVTRVETTGCAESAPAARVTLDAALPLGARDVECRFALVDETADAWALDETGISRVVPLGNATRDDQFWHLAREALGGVDDHHPAHASPARVEHLDPAVVTCAFPPLGGPDPDALAGALDAGALTITVAWRDPAPAHAPAPAAADDEDPSPTPRRIARPALDDPASRPRFATRAWRLATVPAEIRASSRSDLVELRGAGFAPAATDASATCAFEGLARENTPDADADADSNLNSNRASNDASAAPRDALVGAGSSSSSSSSAAVRRTSSSPGGVAVAVAYVRGTRTTRATILGDDRVVCEPPPAGFLVDAIEVRARAMACEAPDDVSSPSSSSGDVRPRAMDSATRLSAPVVEMMAHEMIAEEGSGFVRVRVRLSERHADAVAPVEATAELRGATARDGDDFLSSGLGPNVGRPAATATVRWEAGARAGAVREVLVPIVDDAAHEGEEMEFFEVVLVSATNAATAKAPMDASSVIFIRDDDAPPAFEFVPNVPAHRPRPATYDGTDAGGMYPRETIGYAARVASSNGVNSTTYFDAAAKEEEEATRKRRTRRDAASDSSASSVDGVEAIIRRVSGVASAPSVLHYETVTVADDGSYARVGGEMVWDTSGEDAASTSERRVFIPVDWSVVPDHAEIAVGLRLTAVANARAPVNEPAEAAAVWMYGVERGSCARGFRRDEPAPARDAQLSAMVVRGEGDDRDQDERRGTLDLVPAFHPTRRSYAVATRTESGSGTGAGTEEIILDATLFDPRATLEVSAEGSGATAASRVGAEAASRVVVVGLARDGEETRVTIKVTTPDGSGTESYEIRAGVSGRPGVSSTSSSSSSPDASPSSSPSAPPSAPPSASPSAPPSPTGSPIVLTSPSEPPDASELSACRRCAPGWFAETVDASACAACPPGTASSRDPAGITCDPCAAGWYAKREAQKTCMPCIVGAYATSRGSTACEACPAGFRTMDDAARGCVAESDAAAASGKNARETMTLVRTEVHIVAAFELTLREDEDEDDAVRTGAEDAVTDREEEEEEEDASAAMGLGLAEAAGVINAHEGFTDRYVLTQLVRSDCARAFGIPTAAVEAKLRTRHASDASDEVGTKDETTSASRRLLGDEEDAREADEGADADAAAAAADADAATAAATSTAAAAGVPAGASGAVGRARTRRVLISANVTAVLEEHFPPSADEEDIAAAIEVQRLNADAGVQLLGEDPARFFSHTTKILGEKGATTTRVDSATTRATPVLTPEDPLEGDGPGAADAWVFVGVGAACLALMAGGRKAVSRVRGMLPGSRGGSPSRVLRAGGRWQQRSTRRIRRSRRSGFERFEDEEPSADGIFRAADAADVGAARGTHRRTSSRDLAAMEGAV
jgi:hypothetical protein